MERECMVDGKSWRIAKGNNRIAARAKEELSTSRTRRGHIGDSGETLSRWSPQRCSRAKRRVCSAH